MNLAQALSRIDDLVTNTEKATLEALQYVGESFIQRARENKQFKDQTGNLQSSIGYIIAKDGKEVYTALKGANDYLNQTKEGKTEGLRLARGILKDNQSGWVIIGVAGMKYGIYVEARGIDVISGSIPHTRELVDELFKGLK